MTPTIQKKVFSMENWSDSPVHQSFSIKFFVDTNILVYLIDNTYQSLSDFIELSKDCKFIDLVSSKYVIFEFVGIRKKEHYLRKVAAGSKVSGKGEINFSSLLTYQNKYEAPEADFDTVIPIIKKAVEEEVEKIARDYDIQYDYSILHEDQLSPTFDICLSTKIANQDSLVLITSVLPQPLTTHGSVQLLTNDADFAKYYNKANVDHIFTNHAISKPSVLPINNIEGEKKSFINLKDDIKKIDIGKHLKNKIIRLILEKNDALFLGKTFPPSATFPNNVISFKLISNRLAPENIYLTVISKELNFIYTSKRKISSLWNNGSALATGFISPADTKINVSYKLVDIDDTGNEIAVSMDIINAIRAEGNLVFIHPDS